MKKRLLYSLLPCLMAMFMCTTFTACSDDDDDNKNPKTSINKTSIIGKWGNYNEADCFYETLIFNSDGTGTDIDVEMDYDGNIIYSSTESFEYTFDGKTLLMYEPDGDVEEYRVSIEGDKLMLIEFEDDKDDYEYDTYIKIKD